MRRTVSILAAAAVALIGTLAVSGPASAATPSLRFHGAQYDSPGKDTRSTKSLNAEWISLVNSGSKAVNLKGYTIRDASNHIFTFGSTTIAANGGRVWVHTGKATNSGKNVYWGSGNYVWNNTGDTAVLRTPAKKQHDKCTWGNKSGRTKIAC